MRSGSGLCACKTYSRLIVEQVCGAAESEGVVVKALSEGSQSLFFIILLQLKKVE